MCPSLAGAGTGSQTLVPTAVPSGRSGRTVHPQACAAVGRIQFQVFLDRRPHAPHGSQVKMALSF